MRLRDPFIILLSYAYSGLFLFVVFYLVKHHGFHQGLLASYLTWSFFVLCTPIISRALLISNIIGKLTGSNLYNAGLFTWSVALISNMFLLNLAPSIYNINPLSSFLAHALMTPRPHWLLIGMCGTNVWYQALLEKIDFIGAKPYLHTIGHIITFSCFFLFLFFYRQDFVIVFNAHT